MTPRPPTTGPRRSDVPLAVVTPLPVKGRAKPPGAHVLLNRGDLGGSTGQLGLRRKRKTLWTSAIQMDQTAHDQPMGTTVRQNCTLSWRRMPRTWRSFFDS